MISLVFAVAIVFSFILLGEFVARRNQQYPEFNRKFVHVTVGSFVAFWPLFLTWNQIIFLSAAFVLVISLSKIFNIFKSIHGVKRATWGEVYFGIVVGLLALITQDGWVYMIALLHMSLADGFAAILGMRYGKKHRYTVFGSLKSVFGTMTFFVVSLGLLIGYAIFGDPSTPFLPLIGLAAAATVLENGGMRGLDNLTVPIVIAVGLNALSA